MATPTFVAAGGFASSIGADSPSLPIGHTTNDILLLFVQSANQEVTAPTGYVEVTNSPQGTGTAASIGSTRLSVFWKRDNGAESDPTVNDSGDHIFVVILAFRGCVTTGNPWNITSGSVKSTESTSTSIPGVTTTVAETLIVAATGFGIDLSGAQVSNLANAALSGLVEAFDISDTAGRGGGLGIAVGGKAVAGATGNTTATLANSAAEGYLTIALQPPITATTGTAASSFGWSDAASGVNAQSISGTSAPSFGWETAATGRDGDATATVASEFGWETAAAGDNVASTFDGDAASDFGWDTAVSGDARVNATVASEFGWATAAEGVNAPAIVGTAASAFGWETAAVGEKSLLISGVTRDQGGAPLGLCAVHLFRTSDDAEIAQTTSAANGSFSFAAATGVAYYIVAYLAGSPDVTGATVNTLTGV